LSGAAQIQVFHWCRPAHRNRPLKGALAYPRPPRYSILAGEWGRAGHADVDDRSQGRLQASKRLHDGQVASDGRIHPRSRSCGTAPPPHDGRGPRAPPCWEDSYAPAAAAGAGCRARACPQPTSSSAHHRPRRVFLIWEVLPRRGREGEGARRKERSHTGQSHGHRLTEWRAPSLARPRPPSLSALPHLLRSQSSQRRRVGERRRGLIA
jgi:hypothetical protein